MLDSCLGRELRCQAPVRSLSNLSLALYGFLWLPLLLPLALSGSLRLLLALSGSYWILGQSFLTFYFLLSTFYFLLFNFYFLLSTFYFLLLSSGAQLCLSFRECPTVSGPCPRCSTLSSSVQQYPTASSSVSLSSGAQLCSTVSVSVQRRQNSPKCSTLFNIVQQCPTASSSVQQCTRTSHSYSGCTWVFS